MLPSVTIVSYSTTMSLALDASFLPIRWYTTIMPPYHYALHDAFLPFNRNDMEKPKMEGGKTKMI